jgi:tetratricopeptide (TPR) repeat protein
MPGKTKTIVQTGESNTMTTPLDLIDNYFSGNPSSEEKAAFDKKLQSDPDFADEVALYLSAFAISREDADKEKKQRFRELYAERELTPTAPVVKFRWLKPVMAAAAVLVVALLVWTFFLKPPTITQMADRYIKNQLKEFPLQMGPNNELQEAKDLYNNGKYPEALTKLEGILKEKPNDAEIIKLAGIVSLRMENFDKALGYFQWLADQKNYYDNPGEFYQALTLLKRNQPGDNQKAKILLLEVVEKNLSGKEEAQTWLKKW